MEDDFQKKCTINTNEKLGRYVQAKQDLSPGECVLLEQPSLIMASNGETRCQNCYKLTTNYCQICCITPLCEKCKQHYEYDCQKLSTMTKLNIKNLKQHPDSYCLIKLLLLQENPQTQQHFLTILQAENHMEQRRNTPIWLFYSKNVVEPILQSGILNYLSYASQINEEFLQQLCSLIDVNSFEIRAPDLGSMKGIYVKGALLSHDCMANTCIAIDDKYCMKIYANRAIEMGEIVSNCYTNILLNTAERRRILLEGKYFHCTCKRCEDPTELGSHMSSLICSNCHKGYMIKTNKKTWQCLDCKHQETNENIDNLLKKLKTDKSQKPKTQTLKEMEIWLQKLQKQLHPQHCMIVDVKQNIAADLRNIINDISCCPGRKVYERKIDLCQDILKVLKAIAPGISRLKAIAIYELASTWAEYNRMRYQEKELNKKDLRDFLLESDLMLRESIYMLLYEPKETPEGKLSHSMMQELKYLQTDIKMLK